MMQRLLHAALAALSVIAAAATMAERAQAQTAPTYTPHDWKDCSQSSCSASQAMTYLLWSRESDRNDCRNIFTPLDGVEPARTKCNTLVKGNNPAASVDEFGVVDGIRALIRTQTSSLPVASSSAGIVFGQSNGRTNGELMRSLGPLFAERPVTGGRGTRSFSAFIQATQWESIDGTSLHNIYTEENAPDVPKDLVRCESDIHACPSQRWATDLRLRTQTLSLSTTWGLLDALDVGITVPVARVSIRGLSTRSTGFRPGNSTGTVQVSGGAIGVSYGLGDTPIRFKWMVLRPAICKPGDTTCNAGKSPGGVVSRGTYARLAAIGEIRVPTGSRDKMTGTETWQSKLGMAFAYNRYARPGDFGEALRRGISYHASGGYTFAGRGVRITDTGQGNSNQYAGDFDLHPSNEWNYIAGADVAILPNRKTGQLTVSGDYIGRLLSHGAQYYNVTFIGKSTLSNVQPFLKEDRWVPLHLISIGAKARFRDTWMASGNLLWAVGHNGLRPGLTPIFTIERVHPPAEKKQSGSDGR